MTAANRVVVVGGGGFGREVICYALHCQEAGTLPPMRGYIDDTGDVLVKSGYDIPWLGSIADFTPRESDLLLLGLAAPAAKRKVAEMLLVRGGKFTQLIHPRACVAHTAKIGEGVIISPHAGLGVDSRTDRFVTVNTYAASGHDTIIGEFSTISAHVDITGYVQIGAGVFVGSNASILPKVKIGDGANVGAGSMVYRSVPAGCTVYAPPAKLLKKPAASS